MSMKPGATYVPEASIARSHFARPRRPTRAIFPPRIPMSATRHREPVPSSTRPPRMTTSNAIPWRTSAVPLTSFTETIGADRRGVESQPCLRLTSEGAAIFARWPRLSLLHPRTLRLLRETVYSMRAFERMTYRYHAFVGGRTPGVSPADEEIRAGVGGREEADSLRGEQQLPSRRSVPALRSQGEGLADLGCGRNGIHRLLHGLRPAGRGSQPSGPREGDAGAGVERHHLRFRVGRRGPPRGPHLPAVPVEPPQVLDYRARCDGGCGPARPSRHGTPPNPEGRRVRPRIPRRPHGVDQAQERGLRRSTAAEPGAVVEGPPTGTRADRGHRAIQRPRGDGGPGQRARRRHRGDHPRARADEHGLRPAETGIPRRPAEDRH